jgi:hypothetical protein
MICRALLLSLLLPALGVGCARTPVAVPMEDAPEADPVAEDLGPALSFHFELPPGELTLTVVPERKLPSWSCSVQTPTPGRSACHAPMGWFQGPGRYELLAEHMRGPESVTRSVFLFDVAGSESTLTLSLFGVDAPRFHLDFVRGAASHAPNRRMTGTLPRAAVSSEIARHEAALRGCYQGALQDDPSLTVRIVALIVVGQDGSVELAAAEGGLKQPALVFCMLSKIRAWKFPPPEGAGLAITYPWSFVPPKG